MLPMLALPAYIAYIAFCLIIGKLQNQNNTLATTLGNNSDLILNTSELENITNTNNSIIGNISANTSLQDTKPIKFISGRGQCLLTDYLSTFNHDNMLPQLTLGDNHMQTNDEQNLDLNFDAQCINNDNLLYLSGASFVAFLLILTAMAYRSQKSYIKKENPRALELALEPAPAPAPAAVEIDDLLDIHELTFLGFYSIEIIELCDTITESISQLQLRQNHYVSDIKDIVLSQLSQIKECFEKATKSNFPTISRRLDEIKIVYSIQYLHDIIKTSKTNAIGIHGHNLQIIQQQEYLCQLNQLVNTVNTFKADFNTHAFDIFKSNIIMKEYTEKCINLNNELNTKIITRIADLQKEQEEEQPTQALSVQDQFSQKAINKAQQIAKAKYLSCLAKSSKKVAQSTETLQSHTKIINLMIEEHHGEQKESVRKQSLVCFIPPIINAIKYIADPILSEIIAHTKYQTIIDELKQIESAHTEALLTTLASEEDAKEATGTEASEKHVAAVPTNTAATSNSVSSKVSFFNRTSLTALTKDSQKTSVPSASSSK